MISPTMAAQVDANRALAGVGLSMGLSADQVDAMFDHLASQPLPETVGEAYSQLEAAISHARSVIAYPGN